MDKKFMEKNRNKVTFNLDEILSQTSYFYDYDLGKKYSKRNIYADPKDEKTIEEKKAKKEYIRKLRNHCDTEKEKVKLALKSMGINLEDFKENNRYKIPISVAELIYIISKEDSSINSVTSKLKTNKRGNISPEERIRLNIQVFNEIKQDYCDNKAIIKKCDEILENHSYLLNTVLKELNELQNQLNSIISGLYIPLTSYADGHKDVYRHLIFRKQKNRYDTLKNTEVEVALLINGSGIICDPGEYDDELADAKEAINNLREKMILALRH